MYSRSFYPETGEHILPENYVGTAFSESEAAESVAEVANLPSEKESAPALSLSADGGILSSITKLPFLTGFFNGDGKLFKVPKIGSEEILIIAIAARMFFSKGGDKECALILLDLLFIG